MRLGLLGGSFDPVHYGHLLLAEYAREQAQLDLVWFLPAAVPPHKQSRKLLDAKHRLAMLNLALAGHEHLAVNTVETERGGVSYTVDTLESVRHDHPQAQLFLLMGADSLHDFSNWRDPHRICQLATPTVVNRLNFAERNVNVLQDYVDDGRLKEIKRCQVHMPTLQLSSSEIRDRVRQGLSIRFQTPRAVQKYIETNGLYRGEGKG